MNLRDKAYIKVALNEHATVNDINKAALAQAIRAEHDIVHWENDEHSPESVKHGEIRGAARYRDASISILAIGTGISFQSWLDIVRAIVVEDYTDE